MSRLSSITNYACYYGPDHLDELQCFSLVILQAGHYAPSEIDRLRANGTVCLGYLSLGEDNSLTEDAPWYLRTPEGNLRVNRAWGTHYIDTRESAWQKYLFQTRIPAILDQVHFDGLFLDTLDSQDLFPEIRAGSIALVHAIHTAFPAAILVANRGFTILEQIAADVDGVMFECFSTYYHSGRYRTLDAPDRELNGSRAKWLNRLRGAHPLTTLALDYALAGDTERIEYAVRRARAYDLIPYVSTADLSEVFYFPDKNSP